MVCNGEGDGQSSGAAIVFSWVITLLELGGFSISVPDLSGDMMEALDWERHVDDWVVVVNDSDGIGEGSSDIVREIIVPDSGWGESVESCNRGNLLLQVNSGESGDSTTQTVSSDNQTSTIMLIF